MDRGSTNSVVHRHPTRGISSEDTRESSSPLLRQLSGRHVLLERTLINCPEGSETASNPCLFTDDVTPPQADDTRHCCCPASLGGNLCRHGEPRASWIMLLKILPFHITMATEFITFGLFYVEYCEYFEEPKSTVGFIYALKMGVTLLSGVITSALLQTFGSRPLALAGGALMAISAFSTAFAPSLAVLYITDGVLMGISRSMGTMASTVLIQKHFNKNRAFANGIGLLGFSIGHFVGPLLTHYLIEAYSWKGAQLILSAVYANTLIFALMFHEPEVLKKGAKPASSAAGVRHNGDVEAADVPECKHLQERSDGCSTGSNSSVDTCKGQHAKDESDYHVNGHVMMTGGEVAVSAGHKAQSPSRGALFASKWRELMRAMCDFSLFRESLFVMMAASLLLFRFFLSSFMPHIPSRALSLGVSKDAAAALLSVFSLANLTSRAATMVLANMAVVNRTLYFAVGEVIGALSAVVLIVFHAYWGQVLAVITFGITTGCTVTIIQVVFVDLFGVERLPRTVGLTNMLVSVAPLTATPFMGWLYDVTGNYDLPYVVCGSMIALSSVLTFVIAIVNRKKRNRKLREGAIALQSDIPIEDGVPAREGEVEGDGDRDSEVEGDGECEREGDGEKEGEQEMEEKGNWKEGDMEEEGKGEEVMPGEMHGEGEGKLERGGTVEAHGTEKAT